MNGNIYHNTFFAMGTRLNALFLYDDEEICERVFHRIQSEILHLENKLSYFKTDSEISRINRYAFRKEVELDDEMYEIFKICDEYNEITGGAFDITMRGVIEENILSEPTQTTGMHWKNYVLLSDKKTISFRDEKIKIDLGAFGKGYALEKIQKILDSSPITNLFISFGESSILTRGKHPGGDSWEIGINDLINTGTPVYSFNINDASVSTSSNYWVDDSGQISKKINVINPCTKKIVDELSSVSVCSDFPLQAEILSTAFLVMNNEQIRKVKDHFPFIKAVRVNYNSPDRITVY